MLLSRAFPRLFTGFKQVGLPNIAITHTTTPSSLIPLGWLRGIQQFGLKLALPETTILQLSTFKRKKYKIWKDRRKTVRKRLKRKSLRKQRRLNL